MVFEKTIFIDRELLKKYSDMLNTEPADEAECLGEDETISYTADFGNGMEIWIITEIPISSMSRKIRTQ